MGLSEIFRQLLTGNATLMKSVFGIFMPHAENTEKRSQEENTSVREQFGKEFSYSRTGRWNRFIEGLNRLPRPAMVLSVLGLLIYTPVNPEHMVEVFSAWSLIPSGLWAIMCVIVTFYFGGRAQLKEHDFKAQFQNTRKHAEYELNRLRELQEFRKTIHTEKPVSKGKNRAIETFHKLHGQLNIKD